MGWQGYDNEGCMPGDRERTARAQRSIRRLSVDPIIAERSRLEREVIEAAKDYRRAVREHMEYVNECMARDRSHDEDDDPKWEAQLGAQCTTEYALSKAVDALIEFESSQQQIKK